MKYITLVIICTVAVVCAADHKVPSVQQSTRWELVRATFFYLFSLITFFNLHYLHPICRYMPDDVDDLEDSIEEVSEFENNEYPIGN